MDSERSFPKHSLYLKIKESSIIRSIFVRRIRRYHLLKCLLQVKNVCGHIFIWGIKFALFYDFSIVCWNCSDSVELFCFSFYEALTNLKLIVKFKINSSSNYDFWLPHWYLQTLLKLYIMYKLLVSCRWCLQPQPIDIINPTVITANPPILPKI
jgi:hypothetical protein